MTTVPPPLAAVELDVEPDAPVLEFFELPQPLIATASATADAHTTRMRRAMTTAFCVPWPGEPRVSDGHVEHP
jgi:hypothetical protein